VGSIGNPKLFVHLKSKEIDWRMPKKRCTLKFVKLGQSKNTSLFSYYKLFETPLPQRDRPQVDQIK
jgi:hypothetical protein